MLARLTQRQPSALLFFAQLAGVLLYPFMEDSAAGRAIYSVFGIAILGLVVRVVRHLPALRFAVVGLGVPATAILVVEIIEGSGDLRPYSSAFEAVLYFYAAYGLLSYMLHDRHVSRDELFAVGATFTLVAAGFAHVYTVCQAIEPGSFSDGTDPEGTRTWLELMYLSFTTLTSTGLSDISPVKPFARSLVMLEMLAGLGYVAMVVSRLVALLAMHTVDRER